jgi:hypothetical protein
MATEAKGYGPWRIAAVTLDGPRTLTHSTLDPTESAARQRPSGIDLLESTVGWRVP